ncbi:MAG: FtsX-like permease family protein [Acidimicrobiales bacterium]
MTDSASQSRRDSRSGPVGWFWFRANFGRRRANYLTIVLLVGAIGGLALGSVAAAGRTASSYNTFLASTNPSDLTFTVEAPNIAKDLARLPFVKHVGISTYSVNAFVARKNGLPVFSKALVNGTVTSSGSLLDEYFSQDRVALVDGHLPNPKMANQFMADPGAAKAMGWHVGEYIKMIFFTDSQADTATFGHTYVKPQVALTMHLVATVIPNDDVLLDQVDRLPEFFFFTPALTKQIVNNGVHFNTYALQLDHGVRDLSAVQREIITALPPGTTYDFHVNSVVAAEVNRSLEPESISLDVFGLIAGLAVLIIAGGVIARGLQRESKDIDVLRALGGSPSMSMNASLLGPLAAVVVGSALALGVAFALSPLSPIGPVRSVYPDGGFSFDRPVLAYGVVLLLVLLCAISFVLTLRRSRRQGNRVRALSAPIGSRAGRLASDLGLPVTAVVGIRFALEPPVDRDAAPVRSALLGAVLAVTIAAATLTFGSSLNTLVTHPSLYGWNWNYALTSNGNGIPPQAAHLLGHDKYVAAYSGVNYANAQINGVTVPIILTTANAKVTAPMLSGHEITGPNQIVLGAETMQELHAHLGQTVIAQYGTKKDYPVYVPPTKMKIVGTATLPAIGGTLVGHTSMGVGALVPLSIEPPAFQKFLHHKNETLNGYSDLFVRFKRGAPSSLALASVRKIAQIGEREIQATPDGGGSDVAVQGVLYPAEIENYRAIGIIPDLLALALALGAVVALGLTLVASVNRRRRDLALLRTLGFKSRQLLSAVAWQASVAGAVGAVFGIPLGILAGRWLWTLFANKIYAVPRPTEPVLSLVIVAFTALVLANVVAALPGRSAARTSTAQVLRGE